MTDSATVVAQAAVHLFDGQAGLHELGITGKGVVVGLADSDVTEQDLQPYVSVRIGPETRPSTSPTHGDQMAAAIVQGAPDSTLAVSNVIGRRGLVYRETIASAIDAIRADGRVRLVNASLQVRRLPEQCSSQRAMCRVSGGRRSD